MRYACLLAALLLAPALVLPVADALPNTCVPPNLVCAGEREYVWNSDEECTDRNSYYSWADGVSVSALVASTGLQSWRECRNQAQQYHTNGWKAHVGVIMVGQVWVYWTQHHENGATTCQTTLWTPLTGNTYHGCPLGPPPEHGLTP